MLARRGRTCAATDLSGIDATVLELHRGIEAIEDSNADNRKSGEGMPAHTRRPAEDIDFRDLVEGEDCEANEEHKELQHKNVYLLHEQRITAGIIGPACATVPDNGGNELYLEMMDFARPLAGAESSDESEKSKSMPAVLNETDIAATGHDCTTIMWPAAEEFRSIEGLVGDDAEDSDTSDLEADFDEDREYCNSIERERSPQMRPT